MAKTKKQKNYTLLNKEKVKKVCVIGLGYIGLPTACVLAKSGWEVVGIDINHNVIDQINNISIEDHEPKLKELLNLVVKDDKITTSKSVVPADIYIIAVGTPLDDNNLPDTSAITSAINSIAPFLRPYNLVLIESTCPIGTTETIARKIRNICPDVLIAYCPERVLPGNILHEIINNDRVIGGIDKASTQEAAKFYQTFVRGKILSTNSRTAETVKLVENTHRDINIAYANELSMIADKIDVNVNEVIQMANCHPRVQILNPGTGVGGHCIAIDPWFLFSAAPDIASLIAKSREVNLEKTQWVIQKAKNAIKNKKAKTVACLGMTYKPNVPDVRESSAMVIIKALEKEFAIIRVDPFIENTCSIYDAINSADIIIILVAHNQFQKFFVHETTNTPILDFTGVCT